MVKMGNMPTSNIGLGRLDDLFSRLYTLYTLSTLSTMSCGYKLWILQRYGVHSQAWLCEVRVRLLRTVLQSTSTRCSFLHDTFLLVLFMLRACAPGL